MKRPFENSLSRLIFSFKGRNSFFLSNETGVFQLAFFFAIISERYRFSVPRENHDIKNNKSSQEKIVEELPFHAGKIAHFLVEKGDESINACSFVQLDFLIQAHLIAPSLEDHTLHERRNLAP